MKGIKSDDMKIVDETFKRCFQEYLNSLAEWKIAYKEVVNQSAEKIYKHQFDFKLLAMESFLHHMEKYYKQESVLFEANEILRKTEKYKPK